MSSVKHSLYGCLQSAKDFYSWLMLMIYLKTFSNNPMTLYLFVYHVNHGKWWARIGVKSGSFKRREHITDSDFLCSPVELQTDFPCIPWITRRCVWKEERAVTFITFALFFLLIQFWICLMLSPTEIPAEFILSGPIFLEYFTIYCVPKNNINFISIIF